MEFEIKDIDALGRIGKIKVNNKELITPNLFPVVHPYNNVLPVSELKSFGVDCIFTNAYIIYQNEDLKKEVLRKGIHHYLQYNGIIATDSGAFQQYMYPNKRVIIEAEEIETFQEKISSDFPVILDIPVQLDDNYETAKKKVIDTLKRAKDNIERRSNKNCHWIGPVHGAKYTDLLEYSSNEMGKLHFDIYAIGGLVKAFLEYRFTLTLQILLTVKKKLPPNRPLHMFGLGLPQFFSLAISCGCDLMDSAAYILFAREHRYFTLSTGTKKLEELVEFPCHCPICSKYTPNEVKTLENEFQIELLAKHNLYLSISELKTVRQAIREGNLWELVELRIRNHPNLVKAAKLIKMNEDFFELHEKIYKPHGRLYSSIESLNRPLIYRYKMKLKKNYRVPKESKFLIILPELDARGLNSPTIRKWITFINDSQIIPRQFIHIVFFSDIFGIVPLELVESYPLSQHESIDLKTYDIELCQNAINVVSIYLENHSSFYEKCGLLIPTEFIDEYNESNKFIQGNSIKGLKSLLKERFKSNFSEFNTIKKLLEFFKINHK